MQNPQFVAERIKSRIKELNKTVKGTLTDLQMGINTISELSKGKEMSYARFSEMAEYLECSVDYLLGRTDNPKAYLGTSSETENALISLITKLSPDQQELVIAQIRGILWNSQKK